MQVIGKPYLEVVNQFRTLGRTSRLNQNEVNYPKKDICI
jgi:hypothetical protein